MCLPAAGDARPALAEVGVTARKLAEVVWDLHDPAGYHQADHQVVAVTVPPLSETMLLVYQSGGR